MILIAYVKEYIGICDYLKTTKYRKKGFYVVPKTELVQLLDQNKYDIAGSKLKIWKSLHWIDAERDRVTKRIYNKDLHIYQPHVKVDIAVYEMLKMLGEK